MNGYPKKKMLTNIIKKGYDLIKICIMFLQKYFLKKSLIDPKKTQMNLNQQKSYH